MLTKDDLKQIGTIVKGEIAPLKNDVGGVKKDVAVLKDDVGGLKLDVSVLKNDVGNLSKDMKVVKRDVSKTRGDLNMIIGIFDSDYIDLRRRVEHIEEKIGIRE
jgi:archaellum component FlaC